MGSLSSAVKGGAESEIAARCISKHDASKECFDCGSADHAAKDCKSTPACILCIRSREEHTIHSTGSFKWAAYKEAVGELQV